MESFLLEKTPRGFIPASAMDAEDAQAIPLGTQLKVAMPAKSDKANRFFWALCTFVGNGTGTEKRALATELLLRTGRVDALTLTNGVIHMLPRSIAAMKVVEFREFLDDAIDLLLRDYVGDMPRDRLFAEVAKMCGVSWADIARRGQS